MKPFVVLAVMLILLGCVEAKFVRTGDKFPPYTGPVKILKAFPSQKYAEIGWVSSGGYVGGRTSAANYLEVMQQEAAKNGANAIVLQSKESTPGFMVAGSQSFIGGGSTKQVEFLAIAIKIIE